MRKFFLLIVSVAIAIGVSGQTFTLDEARKEFRRGNYQGALTCYNLAKASDKQLLEDIQSCITLIEKGRAFEKEKKYDSAINCYAEVLRLNQSDDNTLERIKQMFCSWLSLDGGYAIFFSEGSSVVSSSEKSTLDGIAVQMMRTNGNGKCILTGWANNYTGSDLSNNTARKERVTNVRDELIRRGVRADRLDTQIDDRNVPLLDYGPCLSSLHNCVTIRIRSAN